MSHIWVWGCVSCEGLAEDASEKGEHEFSLRWVTDPAVFGVGTSRLDKNCMASVRATMSGGEGAECTTSMVNRSRLEFQNSVSRDR